MLVDTHCHIHEASYPLDTGDVLQRAHDNGVEKLICVGTDVQSSREALDFAAKHSHSYAAIGVHPHDVKTVEDGILKKEFGKMLAANSHIVAIGEIGLDYYYTHSPRQVQIDALQTQMQLAVDDNLPIIFHVRDTPSPAQHGSVWDDFWPIIDNFQGIRGVLHSFTDNQANLEQGLKRGLYIGVNGISTFTKDEAQKAMFTHIPPEKLLLETDAPFLTPTPFRGKVNEPAFVRHVAEHHATVRGLSYETITTTTSANAHALFAL